MNSHNQDDPLSIFAASDVKIRLLTMYYGTIFFLGTKRATVKVAPTNKVTSPFICRGNLYGRPFAF
jgi:hypothetical protein